MIVCQIIWRIWVACKFPKRWLGVLLSWERIVEMLGGLIWLLCSGKYPRDSKGEVDSLMWMGLIGDKVVG